MSQGTEIIRGTARETLRFSKLTDPRQVLVRLCQSVNFGQICNLEVRDSDPVFSPPPQVLVDAKLDSDEELRPEINRELSARLREG